VSGARTNIHAFAIIGVANERAGDPSTWVVVKKVVYTREAAESTVERFNSKNDGRVYFWQSTSLEPVT
jgi:hypothetical protein